MMNCLSKKRQIMNFIGKITEINGRYVTVKVDDLLALGLINSVNDDEHPEVDVTVVDKRLISPVQRRKTYAILRDMSDFFGYTLDEMKNVMKGLFYETMDVHEFSLGNTDITTARTFISFLLEFADWQQMFTTLTRLEWVMTEGQLIIEKNI